MGSPSVLWAGCFWGWLRLALRCEGLFRGRPRLLLCWLPLSVPICILSKLLGAFTSDFMLPDRLVGLWNHILTHICVEITSVYF